MIKDESQITHVDRSRAMLAQSGQSTLNALLLMNGGAVAAFLTFLTPLIQKGAVHSQFVSTLTSFIYGLISVVVAFSTIHLCILASTYEYEKISNILYVATVALCFGSAGGFIYGVWVALNSVQLLQVTT